MNPKSRRKRQFILFLAAVVLPASLLAAFAFRFLRQEEELARQRGEVERTGTIEGVRRELTAKLDSIKLEEMNRRIRESLANDLHPSPAIVFVVPWNSAGLVLPSDQSRPPNISGGQFVSLMDSGELREFQSKDFSGAATFYQKALRSAHQPAETCEAELRLGRALAGAGNLQDARRVYTAMLMTCGSTADDSGMPFNYYATDRLIELQLDVPRATDYLVNEIDSVRLRPLQQATMLRLLLEPLKGDTVDSAKNKIAAQIDAIQQAAIISKDFARELAAEFGRVRKLDEKWFAYGSEPWLLTALPAAAESEALFFAVSAPKIAPPGIRLIANHSDQSTPLGLGFTNVEMEFDPPRTFTGPRVPVTVYGIGLAIILGLAVLGGYLLLLGVNRDLQMAEVRSHFVASVSHELRTPLTAIRMFAETLSLGRAGDERSKSEYLETIVNESERLTRLVDNVLDFSKIEQGRKIYQSKPTVLADVVRSAARAMQYPLSEQGFTLDMSIDETVPLLPADPDAMEQAVLNLLSNAMKYSGDARKIELRLERHNGDASIRVSDSGIGIPSEDLGNIFDKFYRVRSQQTDLIAGTGLGLTLVKHTAEAHGGRVEVHSLVGAGSTFTIRIPLRKTEVPT